MNRRTRLRQNVLSKKFYVARLKSNNVISKERHTWKSNIELSRKRTKPNVLKKNRRLQKLSIVRNNFLSSRGKSSKKRKDKLKNNVSNLSISVSNRKKRPPKLLRKNKNKLSK